MNAKWVFAIRGLLLILLAITVANSAKGQDAQVSQFWAVPQLLNPAWSGSNDKFCQRNTLSRMRFATLYRSQYGGSFSTFLGSADMVVGPKGGGGLAFTIQNDRAGELGGPQLNHTAFGLSSAVRVRLSSRYALALGTQVTVGQRAAPTADLLFPDQYLRTFYLGDKKNTLEPSAIGGAGLLQDYVALNLGLLLFSKNWYGGVAAYQAGYQGSSLTGESYRYPARFSIHGGGRFAIGTSSGQKSNKRVSLYNTSPGSDKSWGPMLNYKVQTSFQQLDLGATATLDKLVLGLWYRGAAYDRTPTFNRMQNDAGVVLIGIDTYLNKTVPLQIGVTYDVPFQSEKYQFGPSIEFSLVVQFVSEACMRAPRYGAIPCPSR
jgi:type IX secretion system PorP/SprF family membrane protein